MLSAAWVDMSVKTQPQALACALLFTRFHSTIPESRYVPTHTMISCCLNICECIHFILETEISSSSHSTSTPITEKSNLITSSWNPDTSRKTQCQLYFWMLEAEDSIGQLMPAEIKEKLTAESALPGGFHYLLLGHLSNALLESVPEEQAAITVRGDLTVVITLDG